MKAVSDGRAPHSNASAWAAVQPYLVAAALVGVSLAGRAALAPYVGPNAPYLQFFPAILFASWWGGFGPGLFATAFSALSAVYLFPPLNGFAIASAGDAASLGLFAAIGIAIASLNGRLREAHAEARREAALATARAERLDAIIKTTVDGIIVIDDRGLIESFNPAAARLFGYTEEEVTGQNVNLLMPPPFHAEHDAYVARYLGTGRATIIGVGREVAGRRKDGSVFPLHLSVGQVAIDGARKFTGILHDLTRRVELEDELREKGALARLGEMAAVIAHEVKNPLAGIRGAVQVIGARMPPGSTDTAIMKEIVQRIDALNDMMKDLLLFARPPKPKRTPTDIVPLLAATAVLLKEDEAARGVNIELAGQAPPVRADGAMLKMVFHNLLINGVHAMHGRGRIRVAVSSNGPACRIAFSDDGPGIPSDVRDKVFIPFFTTKHRGNGLGLPTAKRFIEAHEGSIGIHCPANGGTTVTVELPLN